jgi:hypothetical protein
MGSDVRRSRVVRALGTFVLLASASALCQSATENADAPVRDFEARIAHYMQLRSTAPAADSRKPTSSSHQLVKERNDIASRVLAARPNAKQGEIFTPPVAAYFRRQVTATLSGPEGQRIRSSLRRAEPVKGRLQVNQHYPDKAPLQSTPPSLLLNLPQLPKDLEYRIVGHDLVLLDIGADLIVDFVPGVLPTS